MLCKLVAEYAALHEPSGRVDYVVQSIMENVDNGPG